MFIADNKRETVAKGVIINLNNKGKNLLLKLNSKHQVGKLYKNQLMRQVHSKKF